MEKGKSLRESEGTGGGEPACRFTRLPAVGMASGGQAGSQ